MNFYIARVTFEPFVALKGATMTFWTLLLAWAGAYNFLGVFIAIHLLIVVAGWNSSCYSHLALTRLVAHFTARMAFLTFLNTVLPAQVFSMLRISVVTFLSTHMTAIQAKCAIFKAPTIWRLLSEIT